MKQGILDVKVFLQDGTRINLEMQLRRQKFWEKRSLYYLAKMFADILFVGENFDRLRRCIGISILDFNLTEDDRYHSVYRMRDETEEDLRMIKTKNTGVQKAKYVVQEMSLTESVWEAVEYYRKKKMDRKSEDAYVYDQGKEAGEQIGREKGIEQGLEQGIEAFILDNLEENISRERIIEKLQKRFQLQKTKAEAYYERYTSSEQTDDKGI